MKTQARRLADFNPNYHSNENLFINAHFPENQRNAGGVLTATDYTLDRWVISGSNDVGGTVTLSTGKTVKGTYAAITTDSLTGAAFIEQRLEEDLTLQGQSMAFSAGISHSLAVLGAQVVAQWFIIGGTPTSDVVTASFDTKAGDDIPEAVFICPNITGFDDSLEYYLKVQYFFGGSAETATPNGTYHFDWLKLEEGDQATLCVVGGKQSDKEQCQRFYQKLMSEEHAMPIGSGTIFSVGSNQALIIFSLPASMRIDSPSISLSGTGYVYFYNTSTTFVSFGTVVNASKGLARVLITGTSITYGGVSAFYVAAGGSVELDAEIY